MGASKRTRQPRSLTVEEFQRFVNASLGTVPHRSRWSASALGSASASAWHFDGQMSIGSNAKLTVERGIVRQRVGDVKTAGSQGHLSIDSEVLEVLKAWKQQRTFSGQEDWMFASPTRLGRQPWSYDQVLRSFQKPGRMRASAGSVLTLCVTVIALGWMQSGRGLLYSRN